MASKTQKVITPENLGQGIAYNPQTKKWEVHFVSEAEIEQVQGYVEPQEDDEHYVAKECIKLRDRASGYMWDSCKSTLKDRAHDNYALYTNTDGTGFEDAKAMNEHNGGSQIDINFNEVETPTEIIESGVVKAPWIDVPYLETAVTLKFSGSGDTYHAGFGISPGWSETEFTPTRALSSSELKVVRDSLYAYSSDLTIRATVTVSDLDGSNAHSFTMETHHSTHGLI